MLSFIQQLTGAHSVVTARVKKSRVPKNTKEELTEYRKEVIAKYKAVLTSGWQTSAQLAEQVGLNVVSVRKFLGSGRGMVELVDTKLVRHGRSSVRYWRLKK